MNLIFQCMGITGVILGLYGLLAFAITQVSTWFFWTLLGTGILFCLVFVATSLKREWQSAVGSFVALNLPWIFLVVGRDWNHWKLWVAGGICVAGLFFFTFRRVQASVAALVCVVLAATFFVLTRFGEASGYNYGVLAAAFIYNGSFLSIARLLLKDVIRSRSLQYGSSAFV
jgi:uncharacterized membrane protein YjfL (UPF0719 family)